MNSDLDDVEVLPERFDRDGRPLYRDRNRSGSREGDIAKEFGGGNEMVERVVRGVGDVIAGKQTWGDLLLGLVEDRGVGGDSTTDLSADERERDSRKRERERRGSRSRGRDGERESDDS